MIEQLKALKTMRETKINLQEQITIKRNQFNDDNKDLLNSFLQIREDIDNIDAEIRVCAIEEYTATKVKDLAGGVKIKLMSKFVYDPEIAFQWAKSHKLCLSLNKKAFEKFAKADKLDFVEYKEEPSAFIPTKIMVE